MKTTKKYKSVEEFFEEPIPQDIKDEVNCQVRIIDTAIEFGEWLLHNCTRAVTLSKRPIWKNCKTNESLATSELWQIFLNEKE